MGLTIIKLNAILTPSLIKSHYHLMSEQIKNKSQLTSILLALREKTQLHNKRNIVISSYQSMKGTHWNEENVKLEV